MYSRACLSFETIDKMRREPVIERLWETGSALAVGTENSIAKHELGDVLTLNGLAPWKVHSFNGRPGASADAVRTVFIREMLMAGVLVNASHNVTYAHGERECDAILAAYNSALMTLARELEQGDLDERLGDNVIRPIFQVRSNG